MGIKEKSGVESETWEESETNCIEGAHRIGKKEEGKRKNIMAGLLNYKQREKVLNKYKELKLWVDQVYINEEFSEYTVEKRKILFKSANAIRERGEFAKVVYNRLVSY